MDDPDVVRLQRMLTEVGQVKTPIGKQQIVEIAKAAMTAIRHFKHVVHLIEKFVLKCKVQHKLYGFYMIDSIVRQGQKKFKHKDVFGPRFAVNLRQTLENALGCPTKDRPKVIRVLNLWRGNKIFSDEILHPLIQHCRASGFDVDVQAVEIAVKGEKADMSRYGNNVPEPSTTKTSSGSAPTGSASSSGYVSETNLLKQLSSISSDYHRVFSLNASILKKAQDFVNERVKQKLSSEPRNKLKNILSADFDYSDDDSGDENRDGDAQIPKEKLEKTVDSVFKDADVLSELRSLYMLEGSGSGDRNGSSRYHDDSRDRKRRRSPSKEKRSYESDRRRDRHRRSKDRSYNRNRSPSPRYRDKDKDDKRDRDRKKLGFPSSTKREHFLIASRTIWLGRLPANCSESEIKNALSEFGTPESIQIINSRACAYVTMPDRRSAYKTVDRMSHKLEVSRKPVKLSWATGQGLKDNNEMTAFWESAHGYHQIPWSCLPSNIDKLFAGGYADVESLPPKYRGLYDEKGLVKRPKTPERPPEPSSTHVVPLLPPPVEPVPPPTTSLTSFHASMLPQGINIAPKLDNQEAAMLMAAVASNSSSHGGPGLLGANPQQLNPAFLNTLNALNMQHQLNARPRFSGQDASLPDHQGTFQQFRGAGPGSFPRGPPPPFRPPMPFGNRPNFNGPRIGMNDLNGQPNVADLGGVPLRFNSQPPLFPVPNMTSLPPFPTMPQTQDEPMEMSSPDGPPGV